MAPSAGVSVNAENVQLVVHAVVMAVSVIVEHLKGPLYTVCALNANTLPAITSTPKTDRIIFALFMIMVLLCKKLNFTLKLRQTGQSGGRLSGHK